MPTGQWWNITTGDNYITNLTTSIEEGQHWIISFTLICVLREGLKTHTHTHNKLGVLVEHCLTLTTPLLPSLLTLALLAGHFMLSKQFLGTLGYIQIMTINRLSPWNPLWPPPPPLTSAKNPSLSFFFSFEAFPYLIEKQGLGSENDC